MSKEYLEAWRANQRMNLFLIDNISAAGMRCTLSKRGGRDVARQFAHMHNVRVWQLKARAKDLSIGLVTFEGKESPTKRALKSALNKSGNAIETFFTDLADSAPKRRGFKRGLPTTLSYFIAHESHHRGNILLTIKECGHNLKKSEQYSIWDWDRM